MSFDIKCIMRARPETRRTGSANLAIPTLCLVSLDRLNIQDNNMVFSISRVYDWENMISLVALYSIIMRHCFLRMENTRMFLCHI